jgi:hypothetical protein
MRVAGTAAKPPMNAAGRSQQTVEALRRNLLQELKKGDTNKRIGDTQNIISQKRNPQLEEIETLYRDGKKEEAFNKIYESFPYTGFAEKLRPTFNATQFKAFMTGILGLIETEKKYRKGWDQNVIDETNRQLRAYAVEGWIEDMKKILDKRNKTTLNNIQQYYNTEDKEKAFETIYGEGANKGYCASLRKTLSNLEFEQMLTQAMKFINNKLNGPKTNPTTKR